MISSDVVNCTILSDKSILSSNEMFFAKTLFDAVQLCQTKSDFFQSSKLDVFGCWIPFCPEWVSLDSYTDKNASELFSSNEVLGVHI